MHRRRSLARTGHKEGSCIEPVVASVPSTRHDDAPEDHHSGVAQRAGKHISAAAKTRDQQDLPSRQPSATGSSDPGRAGSNQDRLRPKSEIVILRQRGRGPEAPRAPGSRTRSVERAPSESVPRNRAEEIGERPQVRVEDGPSQRVAMGMPPQRVPAAWEKEGGRGESHEDGTSRKGVLDTSGGSSCCVPVDAWRSARPSVRRQQHKLRT